MTDYGIVKGKIDEIEAEMKRLGMWQDKPLPDDAYGFRQAFGMDTMAFPQWLQFILIPRVREIISEKGQFPSSSEVGIKAIKEFDQIPKADQLIRLLNEFDAIAIA